MTPVTDPSPDGQSLPPPHRGSTVGGESPWLSPTECAAYLGVALGTIRNWTSAHFIPHSKRGGVVRYHRPTVDAWLAKGGCTGRSTLADV